MSKPPHLVRLSFRQLNDYHGLNLLDSYYKGDEVVVEEGWNLFCVIITKDPAALVFYIQKHPELSSRMHSLFLLIIRF